MSRDLILHIGMSKTGSTSIQKVLSGHRAALLKQAQIYPKSPGNERHEYLAVAASTDQRHLKPADRPLWQGMSATERLARFAEEFKAEMAAIPLHVKRIILSAEQFSMLLLNQESVQNLHDLLSPYTDKITVVVYLRRQDQHLASLYSEMIRWGDAWPPDLLGIRSYPGHDYNYDALLSRWASVFGDDACKPRLFQSESGKRFDVIEDFLSICGLTLDIEDSGTARLANQSINRAGQTLLLALADQIRAGKKTNVQSPQWHCLTKAASAAFPGRGWQPTRDEAQMFMQRHAASNEALRRRWFPSQEQLFSTNFSDLPAETTVLGDTELLSASVKMMLEMANMTVKREAADAARRALSASRQNRK